MKNGFFPLIWRAAWPLLLTTFWIAEMTGQGAQSGGASNSDKPGTAVPVEAGLTATFALGEVIAIDAASHQLTVRTSAGDVVAQFDEKTKMLRLLPGEKSLEKGEAITLGDIGIGDRLIARGKVADDKKSVAARQLIVMSKAAIAQKQERERDEWRRRSVAGTITAINASEREVTLQVRSREGMRQVVVAAPAKTRFRRYAADSVKFADARPSSFADLQVGNLVRALGEKSPDGARLQADEIVSGAFVMVGGPILSLDAAAGEISIRDLPTQKPLTIVISKDSVLRRIPPQLAAALRQRGEGNSPGQSSGPGGSGPRLGGPPADGTSQRSQGGPPAGGPGSEGAGSVPRQRPGGDVQEMLEQLPPISITDLKPGDLILASSTKGAAPGRVTAILLAAGADALFSRPQGVGGLGAGPASLGLPSGVLDFEIGLPQD